MVFKPLVSLVLTAVIFSCSSVTYAQNPWKKRFNDVNNTTSNVSSSPSAISQSAAKKATSYEQDIYRLTYDQAEDAISLALAQEGAGEKIETTISQRKIGSVLTAQSAFDVVIDDIDYNAREGLWNATLYPSTEKGALAPIALQGRYQELLAVPVMKSRQHQSDEITHDDIEISYLPAHRLRDDTILDSATLIGKAPRRGISPGRAIRSSEIISPPIVDKNTRVTMRYHTPVMQISAVGEALESGAEGDTIKVRNNDSNTVIQARIVDSGTVEVVPLGGISQK